MPHQGRGRLLWVVEWDARAVRYTTSPLWVLNQAVGEKQIDARSSNTRWVFLFRRMASRPWLRHPSIDHTNVSKLTVSWFSSCLLREWHRVILRFNFRSMGSLGQLWTSSSHRSYDIALGITFLQILTLGNRRSTSWLEAWSFGFLSRD